jgi:hypothetical protein
MSKSTLYPVPLLIATLLAAHGLRKGSLAFSGAVAAFLVGYFHLACPLKFFGVSLIAFYLLGSRATKVKLKEKAKVEDGVDVNKPGGNRDAIQVSSFPQESWDSLADGLGIVKLATDVDCSFGISFPILLDCKLLQSVRCLS